MKKNTEKGFTLIELLVVIAIIGVLASIVLSSLSDARAKARDAQRELDIKTIQTALENYYVDHGHYPMTTWRVSYDSHWNGSGTYDLGHILGVTLPVDPINTHHMPTDGVSYSYGYFAYPNANFCNGQAYMLIYNKETSNGTGPNDGVRFCNNTLYNYGNAFVVGMDKNGKLN